MFQLFLRMVRELFLPKVLESFWSKAVELTADDAHSSMKNMCDFESSLKTLQTNLKLLSAKASDVEEQIKNAELSGRKKRKREVEEWLEQVKSFEGEVVELEAQVESQGLIMRLMDGGKAAELNERAEKLVEKSRDIGELVLDICGSSGETFLTNGMVGEASNENVEIVMGLLESREMSSIGIYGMGGVGKTTLAKHINNRLLQQSVGRVFWVTVSQEFTIRSLQDKLAHLLGVNLSEKDEEDVRATRLHDALSREKNSVLILDDAWEYIDMKKVGCTFSAECCRLIVTTRSLEVCHQICCQRSIRVEKLGEEEAWKLFSETFGDETELGPQEERVAKSVAKMCDGLPLGIVTVAGSMRGEKAIHRWKNALTELEESVVGQDGMGDIKVFKVLKNSFDRLKRNDEHESYEPNMIQQCFLYCSLYPEDYAIGRDDLVRKFISEGLVDGRRSRREQVVQGLSILDKLVNLCLLESCVNYKNEESVKMHDLVRSMALRICKGKYLVRAGDYSLKEIPYGEEWTEDLEKVSLMDCYSLVCIREGISPNCPKLCTLLLSRNVDLKGIPESLFSKMQGLCTLDFRGSFKITMLPNSLSDMTRLKSLILEGCGSLEKVPYLGKMKALRELNLSGTAIKEAPQGLEELLNLRFLSMNVDGLKMLPSGLLLKLVHLEHLNIPLDMQVEIEEIVNLKRLEEFSGGVKSVSDFNKFVGSRAHEPCYRIQVSRKYVGSVFEELAYILKKHITFRIRSAVYSSGFKISLAMNDVGSVGWLNNNELLLSGKNIKDEKVVGNGIVYLTITNWEGVSKWFVDDFSERFDNPTSLKKLKISCCRGIEWMMRSEGCQLLSTLEQIELSVLNDLKGVVEREREGIGIGIVAVATAAQPPVFSSLKRLFIENCKKMRKLGLPVSALPNLEEIWIDGCGEVEEIFEEEDDEGIAADSIVTILPRLKRLWLYDLARLKRVSKATIISNSIKEIWIIKCPELKNRLPLHFDDPAPPPSLRDIWVERGWWESLEWDNPLLPQLLHPFLKFEGS